MPREPPTKEEWKQWRSTLIEWYKTRTADSIAEQLKHQFSLNVTSKMLRDRFKLWNANPKYNRHQPVEARRPRRKTRAPAGNNAFELTASVNVQLEVHQGLLSNKVHAIDSAGVHKTAFPSSRPGRTPNTPREDCHLQMTLNEVAGYIDRIVEADLWILRYEEPAFELQKLAANAHMAISSQTYDCHHIWRELDQLYAPVCNLMPKFGDNNLLAMHPRTLTVLLRLLVNSVSFEQGGSQTLENVKYMFWIVANQTLQVAHPIRLLCGMPKRNTTELLFRLLELMDVRLYSRISHKRPDGALFVAQEQTYAARVLASLGFTQWADHKLQSVVEDLDTHMDAFTKADAYRTLGYVKQQACNGTNVTFSDETKSMLQASKTASASALNLFVEIGKGCNNEAMYTRISLAQVSRRLGELPEAEAYLSEAINVWQKTRNREDQGGSKLILDLNQVLCEQRKFDEAQELRQQYQRYFEESWVYYEEKGG